MRLGRLDIARYGAFADRTFDFGDGTNDLHLVVGANEAGKSTTLAAIGDLLWGMGERPPFAFRYPYNELRLGGLVEHAGQSLDFVRRKTRIASLLTPDEQPLSDSSLAAFLGGLDRDGFDRMFGLNHERLRAGGQNMLNGREDVARVLFEAGTGLSGVSAILADLENEAAGIFAAAARNKPLNTALKDREANLGTMRTAIMAPTKWKAIAKRLETAEADHDDALRKTRTLEQRRSVLERIQRARPILAKIDARTAEIKELGPIPPLPSDAATVRTTASAAISEADFGIVEGAKRLTAIDHELAVLPARSILLDHATEIGRLADGLALHNRQLAELSAIRVRVGEAAEARRQLLEDGGLSASTAIPSAAARLQARKAIDAAALAGRTVVDLQRGVLTAERKLATAHEGSVRTTGATNLGPLRSALAAAPRDSANTEAQHIGLIETAKERLARAMAQLAPWTGAPSALALATVPPAGVIETHRERLMTFGNRRAAHDDHVRSSETALGDAKAELVRLANLDREPPTPELLHEARVSRDASIACLGKEDSDRAGRLADVQGQVRSADELADRREAEAGRLADYARVLGDIEKAKVALEHAPDRRAQLDADQASADRDWEKVWRAAGFSAPVTPQQISAWVTTRSQAIDASDALVAAERTTSLFTSEARRHLDAVRRAMRVCGAEPDETLTLDATIGDATLHLERLEQARDEAMRADARLADAKQVLDDAVNALNDATADRDRLTSALPRSLAPLKLDHVDLHAADLAVTALDIIAGRAEADRNDALKLEELERSAAAFDADLAALIAATRRSPSADAAASLAALRADLDTSKATERDRIRLTDARAVTLSEIATLEASVSAERLKIEALMAAAHATDLEALDVILEKRLAYQRLTLEIADLRDELAEATSGVSEDALRDEIDGTDPDDVASDLADVKREQLDLVASISSLSAELAAARTEERDASNGADAADAAQSSETARATIIDLSSRYIRAKSAATVLRWAINRHRETRQAPLLAKAGKIMANVTGGRFIGLALDWGQGEDPVIVAERAGGERCGVEQMSEGTRDQLFLALRLAAIEEKAADHSMPLICDDLFITADDARSSHLFRQLKDLSASTQVIVFTHHEHLQAIANAAIGSEAFRLHCVQAV